MLLASDDLSAIDPDLWIAPPEDFTADLKRTSSQCTVDCIGLRWTSTDGNSKLTLLIYRTPDFNQAIASAVGAQAFYLQRGYTELEIPAGGTLPAFSWAGTLQQKDLVIITSQGPAIITLFWQNTTPGEIEPMLKSLSLYAGIQAAELRNNGFLTATRQLTPFP